MRRSFSNVIGGNKADFLLEGQKYYEFYIQLIAQARYSIHLQTYIFEMDEFGTQVHAELIKAAQRGVHVYLLIDTVGSKEFSMAAQEQLIAAGVYFNRFNGLHYKWIYQWGRRLHHKILLIDHEKAIVGGINVTTSSHGENYSEQRLDFAVFVQGPILHELTQYCQFVFKKSTRKKILLHDSAPQSLAFQKQYDQNECVDLTVSINDWVYRRWQITKQYSKITRIAQHQITIINSYFFPRRKFMKELVLAAKRGVKVRLILPAISDWPSYILASQYLYIYFLKNGVEIYQWKKSVLHGKMAVVDSVYATIGSFNLNYTSYQQNLEMNIDVSSPHFVKALNETIDELIETGCEKLNMEDFLKKASLRIRFLRFFFYLILSMVAGVSVSLTYQEGGHNRNKYLSRIRIIAALIFLVLGIIGAILPIIPGFPFFIISFLLIYRQLIFNKSINT